MQIKKRDGSLESFNEDKLRKSLILASGGIDLRAARQRIVREIIDIHGQIIESEDIGELCEHVLMDVSAKAAKEYILYRENRRRLRAARLSGDCGLSKYIEISKYARLKDNGQRETWNEIVYRVMDMHAQRYGSWVQQYGEHIRDKKVLPSMRAMQFGGKAIEVCHERMFNCSFTLCDRLEVFSEVFYLLLAGCGCGYSVQWCHIEQLPSIYKWEGTVRHYTIKDSIKGWAEAVRWMIVGTWQGQYMEFNYSDIRDEGAALVTSGGRAPGHLPLKKCLEEIRTIIQRAAGRRLRPIECHDIFCSLASAVLSGGIRRSSLISLFSPDDTEMMYCKAPGVYDLDSNRGLCNNSAVITRRDEDRTVFDRVLELSSTGFGEPGFYFTRGNRDYGTNPCGEIGLDPVIEINGQRATGVAFCNLTEINVSNLEGTDDFLERCETAATLGTLQAGYTDFSYMSEVTKKIVERDALLGVSLTGIADCKMLTNEMLRVGVARIIEVNEKISERIGIKSAARVTCIKPSGTASLLLGCGSGIHPHHAKRYFRRVTANKLEGCFQHFASINPHMVETKDNGDKCIVFPVETTGTVIADVTVEQFLGWIFRVWENWVAPGTVRGELTHNVSATVTVEDCRDVADLIWENRGLIGALTFVPPDLDKKYRYAPRVAVVDTVDEARWNELIKGYQKVDWNKLREKIDNSDKGSACDGPLCER